MNAIELSHVTVLRPQGAVLTDVSLQVAEGEAVGIYGHNGAGKSTLLKVTNGLVRAASGRVCVLGREACGPGLSWIRARTGYVPQTHPVDPRLPVSAWDVALMGRLPWAGPMRRLDPRDRDAALAALARAHADHLASRPFGLLSGGEQQRVLIARALAQEPRILLLDEPTHSLDPESQQHVCRLVGELRQEGVTLLLVSHDVSLLASACSRIVSMSAGKVVAEDAVAAFVQRATRGSLDCSNERGGVAW